MEIFMKLNKTNLSKAAQSGVLPCRHGAKTERSACGGRLFRVSAGAFAAVLLLGGCGFNRAAKSVGIIGGADGPTDVYVTDGDGTPAATATAAATASPTPAPTPEPRPASELIVGKWSFDHMEDGSGNAVDLSEVQSGGMDLSGILGKALASGASLEFTEDGKLKLSVLSVNYSFDSDATIKLSGGILPQTFEKVPVTVSETAARIKAGNYTVVLKRA